MSFHRCKGKSLGEKTKWEIYLFSFLLLLSVTLSGAKKRACNDFGKKEMKGEKWKG